MTKQRSTKRALLVSALAVLMCVSMLIGSTFAWFTDSVTSAGNKIQAGTLDVQLLLDTGAGYVDISDSTQPILGENSLLNEQIYWEPGKTEVAYLAIKNNGNLALKYKVALDVTNVSKDLYKAMEYAIVPDAKLGDVTAWDDGSTVVEGLQPVSGDVSLAVGATHYFALAVHMNEEAGNEYQGGKIAFDMTVLATQDTVEADSFDNLYDKDAKYPVNISIKKPVTTDANDKTTAPLEIVYADNTTTISNMSVTVPAGTQLEADATELVLKVDEKDDVNAGVATQITSKQTATTYEITLEGVAASNDKEIEVSLVIEKGLVDVKLYHNSTLIPCTYDATTGELTFTTTGFSPFTVVSATKLFDEGNGTAEDPYIIKNAEDLLNISKYYHEYKYYKVADDVKELDVNGIGNLKLYGSFDGNGVKIVNLTTSLFVQVGKPNDNKEIKISNMDVTVHTTNGRALVRNIYNAGNTIFENVAMHGYIEGQYNMGSFYNYGTANYASGEGSDYTVSFVNATSDVTLVCTTGNVMGGMLGHGYEGSEYTLSVNMDENSRYTGKMYTTNGSDCYQVMAMCSHATYILNGVETSRYTNKYPSTKLSTVAPVKGNDGYYVTPVEGVDHYGVFVNAQLTAYDANNVKIPNLAGMTGNLGSETISANLDQKVFDLITSADIVNGPDHAYSYEMNDGKLTVYTGKTENYASGWVTLQVNQYDDEDNLLATGLVTVYTFDEPKA